MNKADRYSGLVTTLGVLMIIVYTEGRYDAWDLSISLIGLALGGKYLADIRASDCLFKLLVSALIGASLVGIGGSFERIVNTTPDTVLFFAPSFLVFILLTAVVIILIPFRNRIKPMISKYRKTPKSRNRKLDPSNLGNDEDWEGNKKIGVRSTHLTKASLLWLNISVRNVLKGGSPMARPLRIEFAGAF